MRIPLAHLLVKSPLPRIPVFMERVVACCEQVPEMVGCLVDGNQAGVGRIAKEVSRLEGKADDAKNEIREAMPTRLFLPVDRRDVLKLLSQLDAIADSAEDVGVLLTLREMQVPEPMKPLLVELTEAALDCVRTAARLVDMLDALLSSAFAGQAAREARAIIDELAQKEHAVDKLQDQAAKVVFSLEDEMSPVAVFMWLKILREIGDMANHAENVADQFRLFLAG